MANTKASNKVYNGIQLPTNPNPESNSLILYANQYSGFNKKDMPVEIADIFNSDYGEVGNNLIVQLNQKVQYLPGGPWFVDSRDGVIYIHNRKRSNRPVKTYVYNDGNGELLSIDFTIQYVTKTLHGSVSAGISLDKKLNVDVCDNKAESLDIKGDGYSKTFKDYLYDEALFGNDTNIKALREASSDYMNNKLSYQQYKLVLDHYDKEQRLRTTINNWVEILTRLSEDEAKAKTQLIQDRHKTIEEDYKTFQAKGGNQEATDYLEKQSIKNILEYGDLEPEVSRMVTQMTSGTVGGREKFFRNLKILAQSGKGQLEAYLKDLFEGSTHTFDEAAWKYQPYEYREMYVDPTKYYEYDPKLIMEVSEAHKNILSHYSMKKENILPNVQAEVGYKQLKAGINEDIMVVGDLETYTESLPLVNANKIKYKVKVFKREKKPMTIPAFQVFSAYFTRRMGPAGSWSDVEKRIQALSNQNRKVTERKLICKMTCIGNPDLESSQIVNIQRVGHKWSGPWYIKSCIHQLNSGTGYTCLLELVKNREDLKSDTTSASADTINISSRVSSGGTGPTIKTGEFSLIMTHDEAALFNAMDSDADRLELVTTMFAGRDRDKKYDLFGVVTHKANTSSTGKGGSHRLEINKNLKITNEERRKYYKPAYGVIKKYKEIKEIKY